MRCRRSPLTKDQTKRCPGVRNEIVMHRHPKRHASHRGEYLTETNNMAARLLELQDRQCWLLELLFKVGARQSEEQSRPTVSTHNACSVPTLLICRCPSTLWSSLANASFCDLCELPKLRQGGRLSGRPEDHRDDTLRTRRCLRNPLRDPCARRAAH